MALSDRYWVASAGVYRLKTFSAVDMSGGSCRTPPIVSRNLADRLVLSLNFVLHMAAPKPDASYAHHSIFSGQCRRASSFALHLDRAASVRRRRDRDLDCDPLLHVVYVADDADAAPGRVQLLEHADRLA